MFMAVFNGLIVVVQMRWSLHVPDARNCHRLQLTNSTVIMQLADFPAYTDTMQWYGLTM